MILPINTYDNGESLSMTTLEERIIDKINEIIEKIEEIEKRIK